MNEQPFENADYQPARKPKRRAWPFFAIAIVVLVASVGGVGVLLANAKANEDSARILASSLAETNQQSASAEAQRSANAQAQLDQSTKALASAMAQSLADAARKDRLAMEANGWKYVDDFLYYTTPSQQYSCGSYHCVKMVVVSNTPEGCPGGITVDISFLTENGTSVYNTVRNTGPLSRGQQARVEASDLSRQGSYFSVNSMRCS